MMQHKNILILILTLLSVWFYTTAQAASEARLYLTVSHDESSPQTKTLSVNVENAPLIYGADIRLSFDPAMLKVVGMEGGSFIDSEKGLILQEGHDNQKGSVDYALTLRHPARPSEGAGTLLNVTFQSKPRAPGKRVCVWYKGSSAPKKGK